MSFLEWTPRLLNFPPSLPLHKTKHKRLHFLWTCSYILLHIRNLLKYETLFLCLLYLQFETQGLSCALTLTSSRGFCFNFLQGETSGFLINSCP